MTQFLNGLGTGGRKATLQCHPSYAKQVRQIARLFAGATIIGIDAEASEEGGVFWFVRCMARGSGDVFEFTASMDEEQNGPGAFHIERAQNGEATPTVPLILTPEIPLGRRGEV